VVVPSDDKRNHRTSQEEEGMSQELVVMALVLSYDDNFLEASEVIHTPGLEMENDPCILMG
jgi:hypothetical protein